MFPHILTEHTLIEGTFNNFQINVGAQEDSSIVKCTENSSGLDLSQVDFGFRARGNFELIYVAGVGIHRRFASGSHALLINCNNTHQHKESLMDYGLQKHDLGLERLQFL